MDCVFVSEYFQQLEPDVQVRYAEKMGLVGNKDPYLLDFKTCSTKISDFPKISFFDIINYFKYARNPYTDEELKAIKSAEAYGRFACGWVRQVAVKRYDKHTLVIGRVLHSQRLSESPLKPWAICEVEGKIVSAHCNCLAGIGEACSHVAGLLFAIEATVWNEPQSVTGVKAYWVPPTENVGAQSKIVNLEFSSGKRKYEALHANDDILEVSLQEQPFVPEPTDEKKQRFLKKLSEMNHSSAILDVIQPYCFAESKKVQEIEEQFLTALYDPDLVTETLNNLIKIGKTVDFHMSQEECDYITEQTRGQATSHLWFGHRSGRITASLFKRACRTKMENPSISLIKQICYPSKYRFSSEATTYGCIHEKHALKQYSEVMKAKHANLKIEHVGLLINPKYTYFGASPDALISCSCHGQGCVEVKCPFCVKDRDVLEMAKLKNMCLKSSNGKIQLDEQHAYFYQVQMQLAVSERLYGDFVVWSKNGMLVQRITFQKDFWVKESLIASTFFKGVILPELLAKYFSRLDEEQRQQIPITDPQIPTPCCTEEPQASSSADSGVLWCVCQSPDDNTPMVACDNQRCTTVWYHFKCLNLTAVPEGQWLCPLCVNVQV